MELLLIGTVEILEGWYKRMRDRVKFVNHLNQSVTFGAMDVFLDKNKIRDYLWKYDSLYSKIINFKKEISTFQIPLTIVSDDKNAIANDLFAIFERDVVAKQPGKLICGDYYLNGYIIGSAKTDFVFDKLMRITLTFVTDDPYWKKEVPYVFRINNSASEEDGLNYPYAYPYDFLSPINIQSFSNTNFVDSDFIIRIYGYVENPAITIAGNTYKVNATVEANEILTINSKDRTIVRTTKRGNKVNEFANRDREFDVFKRIPPGRNKVIAASEFNYDIVILEERSEPAWS